MICVNDSRWVDRLIVMRGWGRQSSLFGERAKSELLKNRFKQKLAGIPYDSKFIFSEVGYNFLPLELSAAFALEQLKKFPKFASARRKNFAELTKFFEKYDKYFDLAVQTPETETVWLAFPLMIKDNAPFSRLELVTFLEANNIQTRPLFTGNILKQPGYKDIPHRLAQKNYPGAEAVMRNSLLIGCHHGLTSVQLSYLKSKFSEFLSLYK